MYPELAVEIFKNIPSFIFENGEEFSLAVLLYRDNFYLFVEILAFHEFLKNFLVIDLSEDAVSVLVDDGKRVIIESEKRLVE